MVLAVAGKGGVGKTTLTALSIKILTEAKRGNILAIDANPDSNLSNVLGISVTKTVGTVTGELRKSIEKGEIPAQMTKKDILEYRIFDILQETPSFDILVMGRSEGEGCYCLVNKLLRDIVDTLSKNYDLTVMDMEAGLEHLSRRTDRDVDVMIVVTDPSVLGIQTARRIKELAAEVHIEFKKICLVGNRFAPEMEAVLRDEAKKIGIELAGMIPHDDNVLKYNFTGKPLLELPSDSPALLAAKDILGRIGLLD
ncbi:MAG: ATP-binding protein [Hadesarchaea archaeon DG-33-1]|nr:MAG: ATP-binding protein [Hadesarchaea archaeon DG-33-1]